MAAAEVLRQRMPELIIRAERRHVRPRASHSRDFHPVMIGFDWVARVLLHDMTAASTAVADLTKTRTTTRNERHRRAVPAAA